MKNLKRSFHVKVKKVEISPILIRGSFKRFEDSGASVQSTVSDLAASQVTGASPIPAFGGLPDATGFSA